ncbi:BACON domain-containing carbohydrate-binding protein [Parabacteroides sp. PF5-6]|uniref:BACON domain-containing protein n=1 Tax=Parabacteroides sp. PF5-6 TaxID=1742403 RepID=UPI002406A0DD|nr:BACON domain-containing carbohydrate-binding protein [Parabacteroides sp. PF5-6]MDF9831245.1 hypothetical protein [Parabacteroides sp. PF5-6]
MKQKLALIALSGLLFAACSNDPADQLFVPDGEKELVYQFPGIAAGKVVPYTRADIATEAENKLATLDIYVFKGNDDNAVLERIYHSKEGDDAEDNKFVITSNGEVVSAKISVPMADDNKAKVFFFVGNGRDIISLNTAKANVTTLGAFKDFSVNPLTPAKPITAPLLMTEVQTVADITTLSGAQTVNLTRRMARFDVSNIARDSNFEIEEILIFGARPSTRLFKNASATDQTETIAMNAIDFTKITNANKGESQSVFYIYPTLNLGADGASETELSLVGKVTGTQTQQVYPVKFMAPKADDPDEMEHLKIAANHRYIIEIQKSGISDLAATLKVDEWKEGAGVVSPVEPGTIRVLDEDGQVIADNKMAVDAAGATLTLKVEATSRWTVDAVPTEIDWITVSGVDATEVGTGFTVKVEANTTGAARSYILYVRNAAEKSILQPVIIMQE